jgi:hypothetical protein
MSKMVGVEAQVTCDGLRAAPGREAVAWRGARGGPEPRVRATGTRGSPGAAPSREAGAVVLT